MFDPNLCGALVRIKDPKGGYSIGHVSIVRPEGCAVGFGSVGHILINDIKDIHVIELKEWQRPLICWDTPKFISGLLQPTIRGESELIRVPPEGGFYVPVSYINHNGRKRMPYMTFKQFRTVADMNELIGERNEYS